jgi:DNA (cytosine-5)-methyltransferase 1
MSPMLMPQRLWDASASNPAMHQGGTAILQAMAVRRLTPVECERLQGFPDSYTDIKSKNKPTPDGPRYKALGNSMAVPVMAWIGQRIEQVEAICQHKK